MWCNICDKTAYLKKANHRNNCLIYKFLIDCNPNHFDKLHHCLSPSFFKISLNCKKFLFPFQIKKISNPQMMARNQSNWKLFFERKEQKLNNETVTFRPSVFEQRQKNAKEIFDCIVAFDDNRCKATISSEKNCGKKKNLKIAFF